MCVLRGRFGDVRQDHGLASGSDVATMGRERFAAEGTASLARVRRNTYPFAGWRLKRCSSGRRSSRG